MMLGIDASMHRSGGRRRLAPTATPCWPGRANCSWAAGSRWTTTARCSQVQYAWRSQRSQLHAVRRRREGRSFLLQHAAPGRLSAGRPAAAGRGGGAHRARHARCAGAAGCESGTPARVRRRAWAVTPEGGGYARRRAAESGRLIPAVAGMRSMGETAGASSHSSSRISASGSSPRLQKTISTMIFRSSSAPARCRGGHGAVDHHLAHRRRQHAGRFEEADEARGTRRPAGPARTPNRRAGCGCGARRRRRWRAGRCSGLASQAVEPAPALLDFVGFEAARH